MTIRNAHGRKLVAIGLLGVVGYQWALHRFPSSLLADDWIHGLWFGICIGVELLGVYLVDRSKRHGTC